MRAFYFDVGGVLIPDKFAPSNALNTFRELAQRHRFAPKAAYAAYSRLQPLLDIGTISLAHLCAVIDVDQELFEREWLAMHPVNREAAAVIERLLAQGHGVGLATNFCRRLLDLLIDREPILSRLTVCCSSEIGMTKPSNQFFESASKLLGADEIVFVDDRAVNVDAARRFGWTAIQADDAWLPRLERVYLSGDSEA